MKLPINIRQLLSLSFGTPSQALSSCTTATPSFIDTADLAARDSGKQQNERRQNQEAECPSSNRGGHEERAQWKRKWAHPSRWECDKINREYLPLLSQYHRFVAPALPLSAKIYVILQAIPASSSPSHPSTTCPSTPGHAPSSTAFLASLTPSMV